MTKTLTMSDLISDLRDRIQEHQETVADVFQTLDTGKLNWQVSRKDWSITQCFDHLNLTHDYYLPKIEGALSNPKPADSHQNLYKPSLWGRIYMYFAFNPKYSFPTTEEITPQSEPNHTVLQVYLAKQDGLLEIIEQVDQIDLTRTPVPLEKGIKFNLGDCLKVLVYHDDLHFEQAKGVLAAMQQ